MEFTKEQILDNIAKCVERPLNEVFATGANDLCSWRISYGVHVYEPTSVYYIAFYPAFCTNPKLMLHYNDVGKLQQALNEIVGFADKVPPGYAGKNVVITLEDVIAIVFAIVNNKESFELYQEQKQLMDLGLKHFCLDNYYQDMIKNICKDFYAEGTVYGVHLNMDKIVREKAS
jgi:hypothetical protein